MKEIQKEQTGYILITQNGEIHARCVVNAAGVYADVFHNMVSENKIHITPRRGEYELLDRAAGGIVDKTIFQLPGKYGKGVLVTPTVHGNILIGPTADDHDDKDGTNTTRAGLAHVTTSGTRSVPSLPMRQVITSFAGTVHMRTDMSLSSRSLKMHHFCGLCRYRVTGLIKCTGYR